MTDAHIHAISVMPVGYITLVLGDTIPVGFLVCDGRKVPKADHRALWQTLDYRPRWRRFLPRWPYGSFRLPDLRAVVPTSLADVRIARPPQTIYIIKATTL